VPDVVITVICAPDDGWIYHPKYVERAVSTAPRQWKVAETV